MAAAFSLATHTGGGVHQYLEISIDELADWCEIAKKLNPKTK